MAGNLWKMTAIKNAGKLTKGMSVEILVTGTSAKPSVKQIIEAIEDKYGVTVSSCHCGYANFEIEKLNWTDSCLCNKGEPHGPPLLHKQLFGFTPRAASRRGPCPTPRPRCRPRGACRR